MLTTLTFRMDSVRGEVRAAPEPLPRRFRWRGHTYRRRRLIKKKLKESRRHGAFVNAYLPLRMPTMRDNDGTLFYVDAEHVLEPGAVESFSGAKLSAGVTFTIGNGFEASQSMFCRWHTEDGNFVGVSTKGS
jgi:hypothetical protein